MKYSIVITTYNREKYITKCLDSIVNQTVKNFTVVIIDDGSTDKTKEIVASYQKKYKYIEYYYKKNTGVADSRNYGIRKVKTPYFLFVDSDDYIAFDLMETIQKYDNYDILSFQAYKVLENGEIIAKMEKLEFKIVDGLAYLRSLASSNSEFTYPWGYVYKKSFWDKHKFKYCKGYVMEDFSETPIILMNAENVISIDYFGYYYMQSNDSIMRTMDDESVNFKTKCFLFHYDLLIEYFESKNLNSSYCITIRINYEYTLLF